MNAMKKLDPVEVGKIENELHEINRIIMRTSAEGCELMRNGAPVSAINVTVDFMRKLFDRREMILMRLKTAGGSERDAMKRMAEKENTGR